MNIISQAKSRVNNIGYFENHHIIPESMGGSNEAFNRVKLTAREHFICHRLLTKMTTGKDLCKMWCAVHRTIHRSKNHLESVKITSKVYATIKENFSRSMSLLLTGKRPYEMTDAIRLKLSIAAKNRPPRKQSKEERKMRSINQVGRKFSEESKQKMTNSALNRPPCGWITLNGIIKRVPLTERDEWILKGWKIGKVETISVRQLVEPRTCPYCGLSGKGTNMSRWHFDNCKKRK